MSELLEFHRFLVNAIKNRREHEGARNVVDVKIPFPSKPVSKPATERGPDGRCKRGCHAEHCLPDWQKIPRHCAADDCERHWNENAAGKALASSKHNHLTQALGDSAQRAKHQEKKYVYEEVVTNGKDFREPRGECDGNDFASQI